MQILKQEFGIIVLICLFHISDEVSEMDSELDEEMQEVDEPLPKQEKAEAEVIQVLQVGTMEDGSSAVVGVVQPEMLGTIGLQQQSTIRHCGGAGNAYASV